MVSKKKQITPHKFKGIDDFLDGQSPEIAGTESISIKQIVMPNSQPRRYFDAKAMQELIESVRQHGILQPLLVRAIDPDRYELVAGERRYRAAKEIGLAEVPVIIKELSDSDAVEIAILENLQRQDLNPIEETEAILELLSQKLNQPREVVISLLNQASHTELKSADNVIRTSEWKVIESIFEVVGRFTPESFRSNRLPLLKLPADVLSALREGNIQYTKAREIAKIKDEDGRQNLLNEVIASDMPLREIRERVKGAKNDKSFQPNEKGEVNQSDLFVRRMASIQSKARQSNIWKDENRVQKIQALLSELESFINAE
jgi:ParB family transcriptional regulator, chromosome partitioning protein